MHAQLFLNDLLISQFISEMPSLQFPQSKIVRARLPRNASCYQQRQ